MPADINIPSGMVAAHMVGLTPNTVKWVRFADDLLTVDVIADGTTDVYYTIDGSTPTIGGSNTYRCPAGAMTVDTRAPNTSGPTDVKLIAAAACTMTVQRGD